MSFLKKFFSIFQSHLVLALPAAMVLGFLGGNVTDLSWLKGAILPLTFALVFPMMVTFDISKLFTRSHAGLHLAAQGLNFAVFPFIAFFLGQWVFPGKPELQTGLLLTSLLPTSGMTVSWTGLAKGNVPEAVRMTILGLILGSLATPIYLQVLLGADVSLPLGETMFQILTVVFLPLVLGQLLRFGLIRWMTAPVFEKEWKPLFPGLSTFAVLLMVFSALALKARSLAADPLILWQTFWPVAVFYLINFSLSTLIGRLFFAKAEAYALVYGTVMRNLSLALALALGLMGEKGGTAALIITWAYIIQVQGAAWYLKIAPFFFREKKPALASQEA